MNQFFYYNLYTQNLTTIKHTSDGIEIFNLLKFEILTKEEISEHLLYLRTCMKLELNRKIKDCDSSYIENLLEKKVPMFIDLIHVKLLK